MKDFFEYLNFGEIDWEWGVFFNVVGKVSIGLGMIYLFREYFIGYYYIWKKGWILDEF